MSIQLSRFLAVGLSIFAAILLFLFNPESTRFPPCLFKLATGLQCPGCGSARASYHLLHGNLLTAIDYNLLFTATLPLVVIEGVSRLFLNRKNAIQKLRVINYFSAWHIMVIVMTFWIVRNLPIYPFTLLSSDR